MKSYRIGILTPPWLRARAIQIGSGGKKQDVRNPESDAQNTCGAYRDCVLGVVADIQP